MSETFWGQSATVGNSGRLPNKKKTTMASEKSDSASRGAAGAAGWKIAAITLATLLGGLAAFVLYHTQLPHHDVAGVRTDSVVVAVGKLQARVGALERSAAIMQDRTLDRFPRGSAATASAGELELLLRAIEHRVDDLESE